jgi:hypothetical protein
MRVSAAISAMCVWMALSAYAGAQQPGQPQVLDSVVAIIGGDVLLASDIDEEIRFAAFLPYSVSPDSSTRVNAAERVIDRTLILHEERLQPGAPVTDKDVDRRIAELRKLIPACARYQCETDAGWNKYVTDHGFTEDEVRERWRERLEILAYIDQRFRAGIKIGKPDVQAYYDKTLVPELQKEGAKVPTLDAVSPRIEEILLQQKVSQMLFDWLQTLREQGSVHILDPTIANISSPSELNKRAKPPSTEETKPQ